MEQFRKSKKKPKQKMVGKEPKQNRLTKVILRKTVEGDQATTGFGS